MKIVSIETSCDETAVSIIEASGNFKSADFKVLGDNINSQAEMHSEYGGVYPSLAKREHAKNLIPLFEQTLKDAGLYSCKGVASEIPPKDPPIEKILERESVLLEQYLHLFEVLEKPNIDAVAVTVGPGLEPALWVGINFAKAIAHSWNIPLIPVNHMEGHILAALLQECDSKIPNSKFQIQNIKFPTLALLISGGHTELVLSKEWLKYEILGETRDDAVGEAFDKVARMLGLPYPGGPEISRLAEQARVEKLESKISLPRPMIQSNDFDFSFSGLKTAVLSVVKKLPKLSDVDRKKIALEFENAVTEVLLTKTITALESSGAKMLVIGGGVSANKEIRRTFQNCIKDEYEDVSLSIPPQSLSTDNALMIAVAGYLRWISASEGRELPSPESIRADGNLRL